MWPDGRHHPRSPDLRAEGVSILMRDSKFPGQEPLVFTPGEWAARCTAWTTRILIPVAVGTEA